MAGLVGRESEMAHLRGLLLRAKAGAGGVAVLRGEAGIGKSRLVEAAATLAEDHAIAFRLGRCLDYEVEHPLGAGLDAFGLRIAQLLPQGASARFVIEAGAVAAAGFLLSDQLLEVVEAACERQPLLLVIEDLQWCDPTTLTWLRTVGERAFGLPLAVILTTRPPPVGSAARRLISALEGETISVPPLAPSEVIALAESVLGRPPSIGVRAALRAVRGNPLLALAVLEREDPARSGDMESVLARRLDALSPSALRWVQSAAVLGDPVHLDRVAAVLDDSAHGLLQDVEEAVVAGVISLHRDDYRFRHELYRDAVLATLSPPARSVLHLQAARCLISLNASAADIAEQFARGARPGDRQAVHWLRTAAADLVVASPASALHVIDIAIDLCGLSPPEDLLITRVRSLAGTGQTAEAERLGRAMLREGLDPADEAALRRELGFTALMRGQAAECVTQMERHIGLTPEGALRARAHGELAFARFMALDNDGARSTAEIAIEEGQRHRDPAAQVAGRSILCFLDLYANRFQSAARRATDIVATAALPAATESHVYQPWFIASLVHLERDAFDLLADTAKRGREVAVERGVGWAIPGYDAVTAFGLFRAGALDDAVASAEAALGCLDGVDGLGVAVWCHALLAQIRLLQERWEDAEAHTSSAEHWLARERAQLGFEQAHLARAALHEHHGDSAAALESLCIAWDTFRALGILSPLPAVGLPLVRLAHQLGDRRRTEVTVRCLEEDAYNQGTRSARIIAELAAAWRDEDADRARAAADAATAGPRPVLAATAATDAAALLRHRGREPEADRAFMDAAKLWAALGAKAPAEACAARARAPGPAPRPRFGIGALTPTEERVAALVADGLSNAAVAAALGVSRRTVESHVSAIYRKLDVTSRVSLARAVLVEGLRAHTEGA